MLKFGMGYLYIYKIKSRYSKVKNFRTSKLSHTLQVVLISFAQVYKAGEFVVVKCSKQCHDDRNLDKNTRRNFRVILHAPFCVIRNVPMITMKRKKSVCKLVHF
jgi:hypothetical protein